MRRLFGLILVFAPALAAAGGSAVLEQRCLGCHGRSVKAGNLDLSTRPAAPKLTRMVERVRKGEMPPTAPLPAAERDAFISWIESGAEWPGAIRETRAGKDWWALQPLRAVAGGSIDSFVRAKLAREGLEPSSMASRRTLIRRLSFDLTGLPPSPEEVQAFVNDPSPAAYDRLVERLLASPHYGERWARHWLDVVRFAESEGFERDLLREQAWRYRDYVVRSFNHDKPYIDFAREQIAGDSMPGATRDQVVATGFLVWGPVDAIGLTSAVDAQRALVREDYLEEMVGVVAQTFLGLTVNCARCHDHKFDPIPQRDYYRFKSAFEAIWPPTRDEEFFPSDRPLLTPDEWRARNQRTAALDARLRTIEDERAALLRRNRNIDLPATLPRPLARWTFDFDLRDEASALHAQLPETAQLRSGRLVPASGKDSVQITTPLLDKDLREKTLEAWIHVSKIPEKSVQPLTVKALSGYRGAALDAIHFTAGKSRKWENQSTARFRSQDVEGPAESAAPGDNLHIAIAYDATGVIRIYRNGTLYGKAYKPEIDAEVGRLQNFPQGDTVIRLAATNDFELDEARVYAHALTEEQIAASFRAGPPPAPQSSSNDSRLAELDHQLTSLRAERKAAEAAEQAHIPSIQPAPPTRILRRGDVNQKGEIVAAGGLSSLPLESDLGVAPDAPELERRRRLAEWIANPHNPLFARVIVNRVWHHHFGSGLVESPNDFGYNGGQPSHPELLDWLAGEFIRSGWSLKKLHKLIVSSETYRQSSRFQPKAAGIDAGNRLLWRFAPHRLEGEAVRDAMLAASGKFNPEAGGPSFRPFEAKAQGSYQNWIQKDADDPQWHRRTIYRMNVNSALNPMLESLDCPVPAVKTPRRPTTTTPLQALSLMNDAFANRQAKAFAQRIESASDPIGLAFQLAFGRDPDPAERDSGRSLVATHGLQALCWSLFNASEFLYVE